MSMTAIPDASADPDAPANTAAEDELLFDGQEEVFARAEVERGVIEHHSLEEDAPRQHAPVRPTPVDPDGQMAENFRADFNPRP